VSRVEAGSCLVGALTAGL